MRENSPTHTQTDHDEIRTDSEIHDSPESFLDRLGPDDYLMRDDYEMDPEFPDTEGIGYHRFGRDNWIGYIENVNGPGARGCWEFQATHHEMKIIAKHWYRQLTEIDLFWFQHQTSGSTEWRSVEYAKRRIQRIRYWIGDAPILEAVYEVDAEFRQELGDAEWKRFKAQR